MDRVVLTSVVLGLVIRLLACKYVSKGFLNSFTYSPLDQWQSTLEGVFLRNEGLSTYNNDIVHQMPLELRFWSLVMSSSGEGSTICLLLMELMMVFSVPIFADICIKNILKLEEGNKSSSPKSLSMVLDKDKFQYARTLTIVWYCFNPYSVFSYAAQSTSIIWNIVNLWILITCCKGQLFLSACLCAIGCYLRLYPGYLLFPVIASAYNSSKSNSAVGRFIKILSPVGGFLIVLTGLMYASFILEDKSWAFISSVYIHQIRMADYTPQLGVYWYFFAEMFEHFEELFIWVFQILLASLVVGMTMRFHYDPTYLAWLITLITNVLQPYYCVGEFGYLLSVLFVWSYLRQYARMAIPTFCILLSAVVLAPLFHYMWLQPGVANANFYFAICMVHGVGHVTLVTDLLNSYTKRWFILHSSFFARLQLECQRHLFTSPSECAPSPRTVARSEYSRPPGDRFRDYLRHPPDERTVYARNGDSSNGQFGPSHAPLPTVARRAHPVIHQSCEVPFCENCRQTDAEMAGAQQEPSSLLPVQDTCPNPDDDDASRSWIFKKLPGPWWWCEDCQGCVTSPAITIPHLFAILRQWTPYAQLQLFTIVEEIFRRGAHVDDRDGLTDMTLLHFAAKSGALGDEESACRVAEYLLDEGANLEARCKWTDMTPLHYAAYFDCPLLAELLIRRGADIRARSRLAENATPLHLAASQLSLGVARVLLQASALSLAGKDSLDARGLTPYGCLPPANQLPEPLCTLRDRLAELLGPPAGQQDGEQNEEQDIAAENNVDILGKLTGFPAHIQRKENSSETNSQASGPREDEASHSLEDGCVDRAMHSNLSVQPNGLSWLVAESGYLSPPMRHVAVTPPTGRPVTAPNVSRSVTINHPLPLTSCISARVTLQSLGLALNDRVCIGPGSTSLHKKPVAVNGRIGKLRYCGPVAFASGVWVGVELDEPLGRNNGTVNDVQYFSCAPNHGIFAPIGRIYKAVDEGRGQKWRPVQARPRPPTPHQQAQSPMENEAGSEMSGARRHLPVSRSSYSLSESFSPNQTESRPTPSPSHPPIDVSNVTAKVDTGLHSHSPDSNQYRHFRVGDRVLVAGQRRGVIRFIGQTQFAPGVWYGIELEQPVGKNNGSIGGVRYFECAVGHGIFAPLNRLQRLPNRPGTPQLGRSFIRNGSITSSHKDPGSRTNRPNARLAWSTTTSPMVGHAVIGRPALPAELLNALNAAGHTLKEPQEEPVFYLQEGLQVLCAGEIGIVRYIGPITFADGIWLGIELRKPRGRHDGSVAGKRYFTCRPGHGLLVRPSRVFCRGINAVKLLPPVLAAVERELAEKRHALQQNSSKTSAVDSVASDRRSSAISVDGPGMESHS